MDDIAQRLGHLTDKFCLGYYPNYWRLARQIGPAGRILEVGVENGGSMRMWQELFPEGLVVGVDINENADWAGAVKIVASQDSPEMANLARKVSPGGYDLIVDDASHDGHLSQKTFRLLFPLVKPGGWYVLEDWAIGYLPGYSSKRGDSMLRLAESFLPMLGYEPPHTPEVPAPFWALRPKPEPLSEIDVIEYRFSQAFIHKREGGE
jgi:predicted O-methyltransferase YrrM